MKNVLWFCNRPVEEIPDRRDGTWYTAMAKAIMETGEVYLSIISQAKVKSIVRYDFGNIRQWIFPYEPLKANGFPSIKTIKKIKRVAEEIKPDLVHIWGTEYYWGLLTARGLLTGPSVLDIQGLKYVCAKYYSGGLTFSEQIQCIGPPEVVRPRSWIFYGRRRYKHWGRFEVEIITKHHYISTQSNWVRMHVNTLNPNCTIFNTGIILRKEFYNADPWSLYRHQIADKPIIFAYSALSMAYKGLHVLLRSAAILKKEYPNICLNIAGDIMKKGIRRSGYSRWLQNEARKFGLTGNISWLGPLNAREIIEQMHNASLIVIPSFIESYSMALAEAMIIGIPVVASYVGAMPELAQNNESALFFPVGDEVACAMQMKKILRDVDLAEFISKNARKTGLQRNDPFKVIKQQLSIYNRIINKN